MGYTNYYTMKKGITSFSDDFMLTCKTIILKSGVAIGDGLDEGGKPEISCKRICLNGVGDESCETFCIDVDEPGFNCCKTRHQPYDIVVKAILILASANGYLVDWKFDGDTSDKEFIDAVRLLNSVLQMPTEIECIVDAQNGKFVIDNSDDDNIPMFDDFDAAVSYVMSIYEDNPRAKVRIEFSGDALKLYAEKKKD